MSATLVVRHEVADYAAWRPAFESAAELRRTYGCTAGRVMRDPDNPRDLIVTHDFPSVGQARAFVADPGLRAAMADGGVMGIPRIEIFEDF